MVTAINCVAPVESSHEHILGMKGWSSTHL
jgi:hypothetical protein